MLGLTSGHFLYPFSAKEVSSIGNRIKGITVAINGDTTKLQIALKQVNGNIRNTQTQLKDVERLLRLDPTNTELLAQKQRLLKQAVSDTKDKLATLKKASEEAAKTKDKYDAWKAKYDPIKKKIEETTDKLKKLKEKSAEMEKAGKVDTTAYQTLQREIEETSADLTALRQDARNVTDELGHPISPQQYEALQREIIETERDLESLKTQALQTSTAIDSIAATGEKMKTVGANMKTAGQKMLPVTLAVTAVGTAAVKTSADFEASMSKVAAISGATGNDLEALTAKAREMGSKTKFSASEAASALEYMSIKDKIVEGFTSAVKWVKNLIGQAKSWGTDMIQNIINGLHEKIQDLADGVTDVANTIRDFLHFSVPDKGPLTDYEQWMPDFMQGMAKGIERSRGLIQKAISHVSGDMVITPTANAALIGGYGTTAVSNTTNNSNVTYNFNQTNNSPKALSRFDIYRQSKNLLSGVKGR